MKPNIHNKSVRQRLIERYLNAETSLAEERCLQEYFRTNAPDKDEERVAMLLSAMPLPEVPVEEKLSEDRAAEYDRLVGGRTAGKPKRRRLYFAATGLSMAAAVLALFLVLRPSGHTDEEGVFSPIEIIESLNTLANIDIFDMESMTAEPIGQEVEVTIHLKNGAKVSYLMSKDLKNGSVRMTALNNN